MIGKCYEYFECDSKDCTYYGNTGDVPCWEVDNTLCYEHLVASVFKEGGEKTMCNFCSYRKKVEQQG